MARIFQKAYQRMFIKYHLRWTESVCERHHSQWTKADMKSYCALLLRHPRKKSTKETDNKRTWCSANVCEVPGNTPAFSTLFVSPEDKHHAALEPDLNLEEIMRNIDKTIENVKKRKMMVNVKELVKLYNLVIPLKLEKKELQSKQKNVNQAIKDMESQEIPNSDTVLALKEKGRDLRTLIRENNKLLNAREKKMMLIGLQLPAEAHVSTVDDDVLLKEIGHKPAFGFTPNSHIHLATLKKSLVFSNISPGAYYLLGDLASKRLSLLHKVTAFFRDSGFQQITCPDMVKALVLEGCGLDFRDPKQVNILESKYDHCDSDSNESDTPICEEKDVSSRLYLKGVSVASFAAYLTAYCQPSSDLPAKHVTAGSSYRPEKCKAEDVGLYSVPQTTKVDIFGICQSAEECDLMFNEFLDKISEFYANANLYTSYVQRGHEFLLPSQSRRVDIFTWSPAFNKYFKVGEVSQHGEYMARRLRIKHSTVVTQHPSASHTHTVSAILPYYE